MVIVRHLTFGRQVGFIQYIQRSVQSKRLKTDFYEMALANSPFFRRLRNAFPHGSSRLVAAADGGDL